MVVAEVACLARCCWIEGGAIVTEVKKYGTSLSSPEVSGYHGVDRRIRADGTSVFNDEFMQSGGNTRSLIELYRRVHASCPC